MRFVDSWGRNEVPEEIKDCYEITAIPLLSIDKFPRHYGSMNDNSDVRFETIEPELESADIIVELHESPMKNQSIILTPLVYSLYGLALAGSYLKFTSSERKKQEMKFNQQWINLKNCVSSDVEISYSNDSGLIETITSELDGLKVETKQGARSYSRWKATRDGKKTYGIELYSDWGEIGESILLFFTGMITYPLTEISTYLNRTFRQEQIKQSRLQSAENGVRVVQSILTSNL